MSSANVGTIRMWNKDRGFGFIKPTSGADSFFHFRNADMDKDDIRVGLAVTFVIGAGNSGRTQAVDVRSVEAE